MLSAICILKEGGEGIDLFGGRRTSEVVARMQGTFG